MLCLTESDDGYSGTNYNCPTFRQFIEDIPCLRHSKIHEQEITEKGIKAM